MDKLTFEDEFGFIINQYGGMERSEIHEKIMLRLEIVRDDLEMAKESGLAMYANNASMMLRSTALLARLLAEKMEGHLV